MANVLLRARLNTLSLESKGDRKSGIPGRWIKTAKDMRRADTQRFVLSPAYSAQYEEFGKALNQVWLDGRWCLYADELFYLTQLKLSWLVDRLLTQGRSRQITVMMGMQRPTLISRFALSQATHIICFGMEQRDVKTMRDIAGDKFAAVVSDLERYECAWYYVPEGRIWRGKVQDLLPG